MCKFDHFEYDCACDDVVVPASPNDRCPHLVVTGSRQYCKNWPNPTESSLGIELNEPQKIRGCCGKVGCLANATRAFLKTLKQLDKWYWNLEDVFWRIPHCHASEKVMSACEAMFPGHEPRHVAALPLHTQFVLYEAFGLHPSLESVSNSWLERCNTRGPLLGMAFIDTMYKLEEISRNNDIMTNSVFDCDVAEELVVVSKQLDRFEIVLPVVESALAEMFFYHRGKKE